MWAETVQTWIGKITGSLFSIAGTAAPKVGLSQAIIYYLILGIIALVLASIIRDKKDIRFLLVFGGIFALLALGGSG